MHKLRYFLLNLRQRFNNRLLNLRELPQLLHGLNSSHLRILP